MSSNVHARLGADVSRTQYYSMVRGLVLYNKMQTYGFLLNYMTWKELE